MMARRDVLLLGILTLAWAEPAAAYVGPGAGLTVIGAALAFIAAIILGVFGFVWYPVKRLIRVVRQKIGEPAE